jgi:hypothetical protein
VVSGWEADGCAVPVATAVVGSLRLFLSQLTTPKSAKMTTTTPAMMAISTPALTAEALPDVFADASSLTRGVPTAGLADGVGGEGASRNGGGGVGGGGEGVGGGAV